jgi:hypothetical protein
VKHGYRVLTPFGVNHRYDFVLDMGDRFLRVQCKTGRLRNGAVMYTTHSTRCNTRRVYQRGYTGQLDLFAVFCPDTGRVYVVPLDQEPTHTEGTLRIDPPADGQSRRIRWAKDYELPA